MNRTEINYQGTGKIPTSGHPGLVLAPTPHDVPFPRDTDFLSQLSLEMRSPTHGRGRMR